MLVGKSFAFDAAHRLLRHRGKCKNLHGHTYRVDIRLDGPLNEDERSPSYGMVLDFDKLKQWWSTFEPSADHVVILEESDPLAEALEHLNTVRPEAGVSMTLLPVTPTAENMAQWIRDHLTDWLKVNDPQVHVYRVRVYETATSFAAV